MMNTNKVAKSINYKIVKKFGYLILGLLKKIDRLIIKSWPVVIFIMVLSISAHMTFWCLTMNSYVDKTLNGRSHDFAVGLLDSGGTALWMSDNVQNYQKLSYVPPIFPLFVTATYLLVGQSWAAIAFTQALVCGLLSALLYFVGRFLFSYKVGFLAAMWALFYPYLFSQGGPNILYETVLFTLLLLTAIKGLFDLQHNSTRRSAVFAGLSMGVAALCRPEAFFLTPFVFSWIILTLSVAWRKRIQLALIFMTIFLFTVGIWTFRNWAVDGVISPFGSYSTQNVYKAFHPLLLDYYQGNGPFTDTILRSLSSDQIFEQGPLWEETQTKEMTVKERETWRASMPWSYWSEHPTQFIKLTILKVANLWSWILEPRTLLPSKQLVYALSYIPVLFLGGIGFWIRRDHWKQTSLFLLLFLSFSIFASISYGVTRYRIPLDIYLILMASVSLDFIFTYITDKFQN